MPTPLAKTSKTADMEKKGKYSDGQIYMAKYMLIIQTDPN
jgi:hypothetical protein